MKRKHIILLSILVLFLSCGIPVIKNFKFNIIKEKYTIENPLVDIAKGKIEVKDITNNASGLKPSEPYLYVFYSVSDKPTDFDLSKFSSYFKNKYNSQLGVNYPSSFFLKGMGFYTTIAGYESAEKKYNSSNVFDIDSSIEAGFNSLTDRDKYSRDSVVGVFPLTKDGKLPTSSSRGVISFPIDTSIDYSLSLIKDPLKDEYSFSLTLGSQTVILKDYQGNNFSLDNLKSSIYSLKANKNDVTKISLIFIISSGNIGANNIRYDMDYSIATFDLAKITP